MSLRKSADDLIAELQKGQATLDQIARKLEEEADARFKAGEVNPYRLAQRVRNLASELPQLQASCRELLASKQGLLDAAQRQLASNHTRLKQLCADTGGPPLDEAAYHAFQESIGEWNRKLRHHNTTDGQQISRQDLNAALAGVALHSNG